MALTDCPDCGSQVSTTAAFCPHCGHRPVVRKAPSRLQTMPLPVLVVTAIVATLLVAYALPQYAVFVAVAGLIAVVLMVRRRGTAGA